MSLVAELAEDVKKLNTRVVRVEDDLAETKAILKEIAYFSMKSEMMVIENEKAISKLSQEMQIFKDELRRDTQALKEEMTTFKDELRQDTQAFKKKLEEDTQALKEEMTTFKDELRQDTQAFKKKLEEDTEAFKKKLEEDTQALKEEMAAFKDELRQDTRDFKNEMRQEHKRMNKQWGELANKMGTLVEDIFFPGATPLIKQYFNDESVLTAIRIKKRAGDLRDEFDILAVSSNRVFLFEIKSSPDVEKAKDFKDRKLVNFRKLFPEYAGMELIPFFGALTLEEGLVNYLSKLGIYAIAFKEWEYLDILNFEELANKA